MINRRKFLQSATAIAVSSVASPAFIRKNRGEFLTKAETINIVKNFPQVENAILIISDTLRRDHLGCYGNNTINTPYIDEFARKSVVFNKAYTASFPTVPNRHDFLTGRYTYSYMGWAPLPDNETVISEILKKNGYSSMMVIDTPHIMKNAYNYQRGFTAWEWIRGQENDRFRTAPKKIKLQAAPNKLRNPDVTVVQHRRNIASRQYEKDCFCAKTMTKTMEWLERNYKLKNFFLYVDTFDPHEPWDPPQWYIDMYDPKYEGDEVNYPVYGFADYLSERELKHMRAMYAGEVTLVDRWVGKLLQKIEDMGLFENTVIFLTTDHGFLHGEHGLTGKSIISQGGHCQIPLFEEIAHVPLIVKFPGVAPSRNEAFVQPPDVVPTILDLFGIKIPDFINGKSYSDILKGIKKSHREFSITSPAISQNPILARVKTTITTKDWSLILSAERSGRGEETTRDVDGFVRRLGANITQKINKFLPYVNELYNLKNDPHQKKNVYHSNRALADDMERAYIEFLKEVKTPEKFLKNWI